MNHRFHMSLKQKTALIAALSLLVTGILLGYSAFGWMTMSKTVTAMGQNLTVEAPNNLMISLTGQEGTWDSSVTVDLEDYVKQLLAASVDTEHRFANDNDKFYLMPASSYNGAAGTMWKTDNTVNTTLDAGNLGDVQIESAAAVDWMGRDNTYAGYYIDVPLHFRAYNIAGDLVLATGTTIEPTVAGTNIENTARVAFLNTDADKNSMGGNNPLVYAREGADAKKPMGQ